ncbi:MAG: hypothetical protein PHH85_06190 [Candidatus Methanoperedens sp.]|nr:hypothetical protein [Candidatus Methanoperedens sp.]
MSQHKGRNEGTNSGKVIRDIESIIIISPNAHVSKSVPAWITPAITGIYVDNPSVNSTHLSMGVSFSNYLPEIGANRMIKSDKVLTIFPLLRILGLMAVLSYMIVILLTWIYANHQGYVYFSAGEPISFIKYPEWVLGFLGIFATASVLRKELDNLIC